MVVKNSMSWNNMIDGYMRNRGVNKGIDLFDRIPVRDKVSWTALISELVKRDCFEEALDWFRKMQIYGVEPDYVTAITVLAACANLGALGLSPVFSFKREALFVFMSNYLRIAVDI
ncbi:hypothetical protein GIB67_022016, partial [Kingdonia uniflora]